MEQKKLWNILGLNPRILIYCNKTIFFWVKHFFLLFEIKSFKYTQDKLYISIFCRIIELNIWKFIPI